MSRKYVLSFSSMVVFGGLVVNAMNCGRVEVEKESVAAAQAASTTTINPLCAQVDPNACAGQQTSPFPGIMFCCMPHYTATSPGTCSAKYELSAKTVSPLSGCDGVELLGTQPGPDTCSTSNPTSGTALVDCSTDSTDALGQRRVQLSCSGVKTCTETTTVLDCEAPTLECPASACANADFSSLVTASDNCDQPAVSCGVDNGIVTCTAADTSGNSAACTFPVVTSGGPPQIQTKSGPVLWPPNHGYQTINPLQDCVASITDACGNSVTGATVAITTVTSDEPEDANATSGHDPNGDGHTCNDIVIAPDGTSVNLRAERDGTSDGRVYTIDYTVTTSGGTSNASCTVIVPHDQAPPITATDSGCHLCAGSNCGTCPQHDPSCNY